jgi:ABC-type polysaccharide/polyol phosphate export permease
MGSFWRMTMLSKLPAFAALVQMDVRRRYLGTILGVAWAFISPLITTVLIYFVFTFGLRAGDVGDVPYFLWLAPGLLAWFYLSEAINGGCFAIVDNSHLVTKMQFPDALLPLVKAVSPLLIHIALLFALTVYAFLVRPQVLATIPAVAYFVVCGAALSLGISYITASLMAFIRDVPNVVAALLQFLFWATPILWSPEMVAGTRFRFLLDSPFNYVVNGYREAFLGSASFLHKPIEALSFWAFTSGLLLLGLWLFARLRPHFSDVL